MIRFHADVHISRIVRDQVVAHGVDLRGKRGISDMVQVLQLVVHACDADDLRGKVEYW